MTMLLLAGLTLGASAAQAADVHVPDANLKAHLNQAIATATGTTRAATDPITTDDALRVTTVANPSSPIGSFTGLEAFTNVTAATFNAPGSTATDLGPVFALTKLTTLRLSNLPITNVDGIGALSGLRTLTLGGSAAAPDTSMRDVSAVAGLSGLTAFTMNYATRVRDISALSSSKDTLTSLTVQSNQVSDIDFLEGFKRATTINLNGNRIDDVSVFSKFDASYALPTTASSTLNLGSNRIRDLSPVDGFRAIAGAQRISTAITRQSIYVGALDASNGVNVQLKPGPQTNGSPGATPRADAPAVYDAAAGRLTAGSAGAASARVTSASGSGEWTVYFSEAADRVERLRINEVESDGDLRGDWVELYNPLSDPVDVSGVIVSDGDNAHQIVLPAGTKLAGKAYKTIVTDAVATPGNFALDAVDGVRLFAPGTADVGAATPFDSHGWTQHAATTYGRTAAGAGVWRATRESTFELPNTFNPEQVAPTVALSGETESINGQVAVTATVSKPGGTEVAGDATGSVVFTIDGQASSPISVQNGVARLNRTFEGTPQGSAYSFTARYVSGGVADPYADSASSAMHTVTVTILEFAGSEPTIPATVQAGELVTVNTSGITPTPDTISYQWQYTDGFNVNGATQASYTPDYRTAGNAGARQINPPTPVRVVVTVTKAGYRAKSFTTSAVTPERLALQTTPAATLSTSTPRIGDTISATHPEWTSPVTAKFNWYRVGYTYQWLRDGQPIAGAVDDVPHIRQEGVTGGGPKRVSYTVTAEDEGHTIALRVSGGQHLPVLAQTAVVDSAATAVVAKALFSGSPAPVIDNTSPTFGDTLTASTADWAPAAAFAYQWRRDGQPIEGATNATYATVVADIDRALSVEVTGTATGVETKQVVSAATAKVKAKSFTAAPAPVIDVTAPKPGDRLTASVADWSPVVDLAWQWLRGGQPIAGATGPWYVVTDADLGHALSVRATGTLAGYADRSVESAATAAVQAPAVQDQPRVVQDPPKEQISRRVSAKYRVAVAASRGRTLKFTVSAPGLASGQLPERVTVRVAGVRQSYTVRLRAGKATLKLGARASRLKKGQKVSVSVSLPSASSTSTSTTPTQVITTTHAAAKVTAKVTVRIR